MRPCCALPTVPFILIYRSPSAARRSVINQVAYRSLARRRLMGHSAVLGPSRKPGQGGDVARLVSAVSVEVTVSWLQEH